MVVGVVGDPHEEEEEEVGEGMIVVFFGMLVGVACRREEGHVVSWFETMKVSLYVYDEEKVWQELGDADQLPD